MKNLIKTWIVSAALAASSLSASANDFPKTSDTINITKSNLSNALNVRWWDESMRYNIDARVFTDAALSYFDEEVRLYDLKWEAREQVESVLMSYFSRHPVLKMSENGELELVIDDKKEFESMIRKLADAILWWMSPLLRTIWITIAFWWHSWMERQLNNIWETLHDLKPKLYKNIVFDYVWWIITRAAKSSGWKMTIKNYYKNVDGYYPNKNFEVIMSELDNTGQWSVDIKNLKYPFKK